MAEGFTKGQRKSVRKYKWDENFYLARSDPEQELKPRIESEPLRIRVNKQAWIGDIEHAWEAIGVKLDIAHYMDHLAMLERWRRRLIRIEKCKLNSD